MNKLSVYKKVARQEADGTLYLGEDLHRFSAHSTGDEEVVVEKSAN